MNKLRQYAAGVTVGLMAIMSGCADLTEGSNRMSFRPTQFGRVYVTDETDKKILYQGEVEKGDMVEVNAQDDRILVGGRTVTEQPMVDSHQYRVFFEPMSHERTVRYKVVDEPAR